MTIRDLLDAGATLDSEISVSVEVVNDWGDQVGIDELHEERIEHCDKDEVIISGWSCR